MVREGRPSHPYLPFFMNTMKKLLLILILVSSTSRADILFGSGLTDYYGNGITSTGSSLNVNTTNVNANGTLSATQSVTTSESTLAAPSNAVGVVLESDSSNTNNVRWGFSKSTSSILSSTLGMLMEPGRDSGILPFGAGTYLHLISLSGTNSVNVQWIQSQ